ncbi:MAG: tryptophan--tRNA ligase [Cytophagales bacterium]|nr:MAG: tryptophan--tRNA ligase [Cytophagales bacterium]TAF62137.1 MAG: tryptophan--tRNA ligase [Cytophagales bacterium]
MARILTGIQSSGRPHLGNILGAIQPAVALSRSEQNNAFVFIADLHSLTSMRDAGTRLESVKAVAAAWLAFGFDTQRNVFYRQSQIPEVCELAWYLSCFTPFPMLANAHSFKDKSENLAMVNAGLFTYPVLMAADILLYDAHFVPVGKDQKQHLEITKDIANAFNNHYQKPIFVVPEPKISEATPLIMGTDGRKMSKSYQNTIDIFLPKNQLKKQVMSIVTDSLPLEEPKNPDTCNVFKLFELVAEPNDTETLRQKYLAGNFGYGHAKNALLDVLVAKYEKEAEAFNHYMSDEQALEKELINGEQKAREIASKTLTRVRECLGF